MLQERPPTEQSLLGEHQKHSTTTTRTKTLKLLLIQTEDMVRKSSKENIGNDHVPTKIRF